MKPRINTQRKALWIQAITISIAILGSFQAKAFEGEDTKPTKQEKNDRAGMYIGAGLGMSISGTSYEFTFPSGGGATAPITVNGYNPIGLAWQINVGYQHALSEKNALLFEYNIGTSNSFNPTQFTYKTGVAFQFQHNLTNTTSAGLLGSVTHEGLMLSNVDKAIGGLNKPYYQGFSWRYGIGLVLEKALTSKDIVGIQGIYKIPKQISVSNCLSKSCGAIYEKGVVDPAVRAVGIYLPSDGHIMLTYRRIIL